MIVPHRQRAMTRLRVLILAGIVLLAGRFLPAGDCNGNGRPDTEDVRSGESEDCDANNYPDECEVLPLPFGAPVTLPLTGRPKDFSAADLDLDGLLDLAVSTSGESGVAILLQRQQGEFEETVYNTGERARKISTGDLDGDGTPDVAALGSTGVVLLLNRGDGSFQDPRALELGTPNLLRTEDLDGDGVDDLVVGDSDSGIFSVLLSQSDGSFADALNHDVGPGTTEVALGDLDGDANLDLAALNQATAEIVFLWNAGKGRFAPPTRLSEIGDRPVAFEIADLDGDGLPDIAVLDHTSLRFFPNTGPGSFGEAVAFSLGKTLPPEGLSGLESADLEADGDLDLLVTATYFDNLRAVINSGNGTFEAALSLSLEEIFRTLKTADLDADGDPDLIVSDGLKLQTLINDDLPTALPVRLDAQTVSARLEPHFSVLDDADGDGDLDIAMIDGEQLVSILLNNGSGGFSANERIVIGVQGGSELISLAMADLDNDADLDVTTVDEAGSLYVILRGDDGRYQQTRHPLGGGFRFVTTADIDGDGFRDLIAANPGRNNISILLNRGDGSFGENDPVAAGSNPLAVAMADLDADGHVDMAVANNGSSQLSLHFGDGKGKFPEQSYHDVHAPTYLASADIDGDGDLDLAVSGAPGVSIFHNEGGRAFSSLSILQGGLMSSSVITLDLNRDGLLDLAGSSGRGIRLATMLNRGNDIFSPPSFHPVGLDTRFVVAGDLDGDGDDDLVAANHSSRSLTVLLNRSPPRPLKASLERICTEADFFRVAVSAPAGGAGRWLTKYVVPADPTAAGLLPPLFQDVRIHGLHQEFLAAEFPKRFPFLSADVYDQLVGRRATRQYFVGVVYLLQTGEGPLFGFNVLASFFADAAELPTTADVRGVYDTLRAVFAPEPLAYFPDTLVAREDALTWQEPGFPIHFEDPRNGPSFQAYTRGTGYGRVRHLDREAFEAANSSGRISFQDILILEEAPRDIEGVVGGVVTAQPQGELSHLAVRTSIRGTPNCHVANALEAFADLEGKLIRLVVEEAGYRTEEVTPEEAAAGWEDIRPEVSEFPTVDPDYSAIDRFSEMDLSGKNSPPVARHGGKATHLARLQRILDGPFQKYREVGFSVPVHYYLDFLRSNRLSSARDAAREVTYEEFLHELSDWGEFQSDAQLRFEVLDDLRDHMRNHGQVDPELITRLGNRVEEVFGTIEKRVRFRSSSNTEDILEFNGAGLYDSTSACVRDDRDDDSTGPSLCDTSKDNERGVERALKRVWRSLWTFRAHEERAFFGLPQDLSAMGVLVSRSFPDELANGVAFTGNPASATDRRYVVTAQVGEESVVSPDPGILAEKTLLSVEEGAVVEIVRASSSTLVPLGGVVLSDEKLEELGALLWHIDTNFPVNPGEHHREDILLDVEFKIEPGGDLAVKQVRPFLHNVVSTPAPNFELVVAPGTAACGTFVQSRSPRNAYELKSTVRFAAGRISLPTDADTFRAKLIEEVRVGPKREVAVSQESGLFRVTRSLASGLTTYRFRYEQDFTLPDGTPFQLKISNLAFEARGDEAVEASRVLDRDSLDAGLGVQGNLGLVVTYASCGQESLPLWEILVELEDGSALRLLERHEPPPTVNHTGPASLVHASLELASGIHRSVSDYWHLVYAALRHNRGVRHWVVLDPPGMLAGMNTRVRVVEVVAPVSEDVSTASVNYLDADFELIASVGVSSYTRTALSGPGMARFQRGDVRADGVLNLSDVITLLRHLFGRDQAPQCHKTADANDDGRVTITDAVAILHQLFLDAGPLPEPFGTCGVDATVDDLPCPAHPPCPGS